MPATSTSAPTCCVVVLRGTVVRRTGHADSRQDHGKTDASTRPLAVPDFAAQVLRRRIGQMGPDQAQMTIFHNRDGGVISLHNLRRTFRAFLTEAGSAAGRRGSPGGGGGATGVRAPRPCRETMMAALSRRQLTGGFR